MHKGCVLGIHDAQIACQPQFGLIVLTRRIDQVGLGACQRSLCLHYRQVIVNSGLKAIRSLFQFFLSQFYIALRHAHQFSGCLHVQNTVPQLLIDLLSKSGQLLDEAGEVGLCDATVSAELRFLKNRQVQRPRAQTFHGKALRLCP